MTSKQIIYGCMVIGSMIGGWVPSLLWDAGIFDLSVVLTTAVGGVAGIYIGWKITN
jgi:hypothetical protein